MNLPTEVPVREWQAALEALQDSPPGYPQTKRYEWWRRHDEYEHA